MPKDVPPVPPQNASLNAMTPAVIASVMPPTVSHAKTNKSLLTSETVPQHAEIDAMMENSTMKTRRDADHALTDAMFAPTRLTALNAMLDSSTNLVKKHLSVWNHALKAPLLTKTETAMPAPKVALNAIPLMSATLATPSPLSLMTSVSVNSTMKLLPDPPLNTSKLTSSTFTSTAQKSTLPAVRDSTAMRFSTLTPHLLLTSISLTSGAMVMTDQPTKPSDKESPSDPDTKNN